MKKIRDMIVCMAVVCGFWGMMYPDFSLTADTYCKVENGVVSEVHNSTEDFQKIMAAEPGEVVIRFAVVERWKEFKSRWEQTDENRGNGSAAESADRSL